MTHRVYLGVGSNIRPVHHIAAGLDELNRRFELICVSSVYESEAVGFDGDNFLNLVAGIRTELALSELHRQLRSLEFDYGREAECTKFSSRTLDIDILSYDALYGEYDGILLPRPETLVNAFVLRPFAEIAPALVLPGQTESLLTLWRRYDTSKQPLERRSFDWNDGQLPVFRNTDDMANARAFLL